MQFSKSINSASAPVWKEDVAEIKEKSKAKQYCSVLAIRKPRQCSHLFPVTYPEFLPGDRDN